MKKKIIINIRMKDNEEVFEYRQYSIFKGYIRLFKIKERKNERCKEETVKESLVERKNKLIY